MIKSCVILPKKRLPVMHYGLKISLCQRMIGLLTIFVMFFSTTSKAQSIDYISGFLDDPARQAFKQAFDVYEPDYQHNIIGFEYYTPEGDMNFGYIDLETKRAVLDDFYLHYGSLWESDVDNVYCYVDRDGRHELGFEPGWTLYEPYYYSDYYSDYEFYEFLEDRLPIICDGKFGYIDRHANLVVDFIWDEALGFHDGMAAVKLNDKWGFIDKTGFLVVDVIYDKVWRFSDGYAWVIKKGQPGIVDKGGYFLPQPEGYIGEAFDHGMSLIEHEGKFGFVNKHGVSIIKPVWDDIGFSDYDGPSFVPHMYYDQRKSLPRGEGHDFYEGFIRIQKGGLYGFANQYGNIIEPQWDDLWVFTEGLARVKIDQRYGFINKSGDYQVLPVWDNAEPFSEGLAPVWSGDKFGYIDYSGEMVLPLKYDGGGDFIGGLALVWKDGKHGYIDRTGEEVIALQWYNATPFEVGEYSQLAFVTLESRETLGTYSNGSPYYPILEGFINRQGEYVLTPRSMTGWTFWGNDFIIYLDGEDGLYYMTDLNGNIIL